LQVSGPQRDLHSGNDGGVFSEPMADLVQLLGSLHGPGGQISVPGFNNAVRPQLMDLAWQGLQHSEEFSMQSYRWVKAQEVLGFSCESSGFEGCVQSQLMDLAWQGLQHSKVCSRQSYRWVKEQEVLGFFCDSGRLLGVCAAAADRPGLAGAATH
jgi:hypothetical protein